MSASSDEFYLNEWEIWHTYTTSLKSATLDLKSLADDLIESDLAHLSMLRDGYTVWKSKNRIGKGYSKVILESSNSRAKSKLEKEDPQTIDLEDFTLEAWYQSCYFRYSELRLFDSYTSLPPLYVRAFLGKCVLYKDLPEQRIHLYPVLTVYETGVMSVELRTISPSNPLSLDEFISGGVNLFNIPFHKAEVPPALSKIASRAYVRSSRNWNLRERVALLRMEKIHDNAVIKNANIDDDIDFTFELSPLSLGEVSQEETLASLAHTIFDSVAYLLSKPNKGLNFVLWGQSNLVEFDGYWIGRPHIYLCNFSDQQETAKMNEEIHKNAFTKIIMRSNEFPSDLRGDYLPENVRLFNDYSVYLGQTVSLWIWSKQGIKRYEPWKDANRGHLIYEQQATMRLLEYVYILHRRLLNEIDEYKNTDQVLSVRRELIHFEQEIAELSKYGEIRTLLEYGLNQLGLEGIKKRIDEILEVQQIERSHQETRNNRKIGRALTLLFGLAAIPVVAYQLLQPIWEWLSIPKPESELSFSILLLGITLGMIITLVWFILRSK